METGEVEKWLFCFFTLLLGEGEGELRVSCYHSHYHLPHLHTDRALGNKQLLTALSLCRNGFKTWKAK